MIKNPEKIDLFVVLDISGSMNMSCNKAANAVNSGAGHIIFSLGGAGLAAAAAFSVLTGGASIVAAGLISLGTIAAQKKIADTKSRLAEAKYHLIIQIKDLI